MHATSKILEITIQSKEIHNEIAMLESKALIYKFLRVRLHPNMIKACMNHSCKVNGEISLRFYSNGYFLALFTCETDKDIAFEVGPWFHGREGIFMKPWHTGFNLEEESPSMALVWICMPNLSSNCGRRIFFAIGDSLGSYMGVAYKT